MQNQLRSSLATGAGLLLIGGGALAFAPGASAAPTPSPSSTVESSAAPTSSAPSRPVQLPSSSEAPPVPTLSATPVSGTGGIAVPAGNAGTTEGSDDSGTAVTLLLGAGALLVAGGTTVAVRRR